MNACRSALFSTLVAGVLLALPLAASAEDTPGKIRFKQIGIGFGASVRCYAAGADDAIGIGSWSGTLWRDEIHECEGLDVMGLATIRPTYIRIDYKDGWGNDVEGADSTVRVGRGSCSEDNWFVVKTFGHGLNARDVSTSC